MNSRLRWRSLTKAWTLPVSRSIPANRLSVPWRLAVILGLVARQRHQPGFGLRCNRWLLARSGSVIKRHQRSIGQRPLDAALDRLMMHAHPLTNGKKRWALAIS